MDAIGGDGQPVVQLSDSLCHCNVVLRCERRGASRGAVTRGLRGRGTLSTVAAATPVVAVAVVAAVGASPFAARTEIAELVAQLGVERLLERHADDVAAGA